MKAGQIGLTFNTHPEDPHRFTTSFANPDNPGRVIFLTVCADHCLKRQARALYDSHPQRHREFRRPVAAGGSNVEFGFLPVENTWRAEQGNPHKTANLQKRVIFRDRISDLSVPIALAVCKKPVVEAIKARAAMFTGHAKHSALETAEYLERLHHAYHGCLLNTAVKLDDPSKLDNVTRLYDYYRRWTVALHAEGKPVLASKGFKEGIAYQT